MWGSCWWWGSGRERYHARSGLVRAQRALGSAAWALIPLQLQGERMCGCQLGSLEPSGGSERDGWRGRKPKQVPPPTTTTIAWGSQTNTGMDSTEKKRRFSGRGGAENDTKGDKRTQARLNGRVSGISTLRPYQRSQWDATLPLCPLTFTFAH